MALQKKLTMKNGQNIKFFFFCYQIEHFCILEEWHTYLFCQWQNTYLLHSTIFLSQINETNYGDRRETDNR